MLMRMPRPYRQAVGMMLLVVTLLFGGVLAGCGHDPNHDIDMEKARAAANRVKPPPPPGEKRIPGHGG